MNQNTVAVVADKRDRHYLCSVESSSVDVTPKTRKPKKKKICKRMPGHGNLDSSRSSSINSRGSPLSRPGAQKGRGINARRLFHGSSPNVSLAVCIYNN